jgi:membrane protein
MVGRHLFGLYLAHAGTANSFGAAGSLAVLMMWLFFSAVVFLFGAEIAATLKQPTSSGGEMDTKKPAFATGTRH